MEIRGTKIDVKDGHRAAIGRIRVEICRPCYSWTRDEELAPDRGSVCTAVGGGGVM